MSARDGSRPVRDFGSAAPDPERKPRRREPDFGSIPSDPARPPRVPDFGLARRRADAGPSDPILVGVALREDDGPVLELAAELAEATRGSLVRYHACPAASASARCIPRRARS